MTTIAIELNHVVRNINKQLIKYYAKEYDPSLDIDMMDDKVDVFEHYLKFDSKNEKYRFVYIDYPYEIFGCAKTMEKNLAVRITNWLTDMTNIEDEQYNIIFYSLDEDNLTIQSTYFFLSKIGCRVRTMMFPKSYKEIWDVADVVVTARNEFFDNEKPEGKKLVIINRDFNEDNKERADLSYDSMTELCDDTSFFDKIKP